MDTNSKVFLAAVFTGIVVVWFFVWPNVQDTQELRRELQEEQEELSVLSQTQNTIEEAVSFLENLSQQDKTKVELAAPSFDSRVDAVDLLRGMAQDTGLSIETITVAEGEPASRAGELGTVGVSIGVSGDYDDIKNYISLLEESLRILNIETVSVAPNSGANEQDDFSADISATAYYKTERDSAGGSGTGQSGQQFFLE